MERMEDYSEENKEEKFICRNSKRVKFIQYEKK